VLIKKQFIVLFVIPPSQQTPRKRGFCIPEGREPEKRVRKLLNEVTTASESETAPGNPGVRAVKSESIPPSPQQTPRKRGFCIPEGREPEKRV